MRERTSSVISKAASLKVRCWKLLKELATEQKDPLALALIISLAENSQEGRGEDPR